MQMSGKAPRQKGDRLERKCVNLFKDSGIEAERVPLSGSMGGSFAGDIQVPFGGQPKRPFECKKRARAWKDLYDWIEPNYALIIERDRSEPLVVVRLKDFIEVIK